MATRVDQRRPAAAAEISASSRRTGRGWAFWGFFAVYVAGVLLLLSHGIAAIIASAVPAFHEAMHLQGLGSGPLARAALRAADSSHQIGSGLQVALDYGFSLYNIALAAFLVWLRPRDWTARLLAIGMVGTAAAFNLTAQMTFEAIPATSVESFLKAANHLVTGLAYVAALVLFPDGRPVPRLRAPLLAVLYAPVILGAVALGLGVEGSARPATLVLFFGLLVPAAGVLSQGYRFSRSPTAESHQQARLLFWSLLPALGIGAFLTFTQRLVPSSFGEFAGRGLTQLPVTPFRVFQLVFAIIPLALIVGLLRYRLWDIDRVLNRTLVYSTLTAVLALVYVGAVVLFQSALRPFTRSNDLAVALSTVAVMSAFRPARSRVQQVVDRQFNRHRYDASRTIEDFAHRLRDELDLDSMTAQLRSVVLETMQPAHVTLWLRSPSEPGDLRNAARNAPATTDG